VAIALAAVLGLTAFGKSTLAVDPSSVLAAQPLEIVGHLGGAPHDVLLRDGYAYLATGYAFEVWDVHDPARSLRVGQLVRRGFLPSPDSGDVGSPCRLILDGRRAYVLDRNMVRIIDIADPAAPKEAGVYSFWTDITDMAARANTLYLSARPGGVGVATVDISDPAAPKLVSYSDDGIFRNLALVGSTLLAIGDLSNTGSGPIGIRAYDITVPQLPRRVALTAPIQINAYDLAVQAPYLYATWNGGLHVYDVANPSAIHEVAFYRTTEPADTVALDNGRAYLAGGSAIEVLDVADPTQPRRLGSLPLAPWWGDVGNGSIAAAAGLAMVTQRYSGLIRLVDVSDPANLHEVARLDAELPQVPRIAVGARHAYVMNTGLQPRGLTVVDVSTPAKPLVVGTFPFPSDGRQYGIRDLVLNGTKLYLLIWIESAHSELHVLDLADPVAPRREAVVDLGEVVGQGLIVREGLAYVSTYLNGTGRSRLYVVDLLEATGPRVLATADLSGTLDYEGWPAVALLGHHALVAGNSMKIVNIADPAQPVTVNPPKMGAAAIVATRANGYLVHQPKVSSARNAIGTIDVADVAAPHYLGSYEPNWWPRTLGLSADHLFAGSPEGVQMFDISRPERLRRLADVSLPSEVQGIVLRNGFAYVADGDAGLFILHTGDADVPELVPPTRTPAPRPSSTPVSPPTPSPTATQQPGPAGAVARVCPQVLARVPGAVLNAALANPERIQGWNQLQNPNAPAGPFNLRRVWLTIRNVGVPFNFLFNPILYRASCP
jgi:hypothetical protein